MYAVGGAVSYMYRFSYCGRLLLVLHANRAQPQCPSVKATPNPPTKPTCASCHESWLDCHEISIASEAATYRHWGVAWTLEVRQVGRPPWLPSEPRRSIGYGYCDGVSAGTVACLPMQWLWIYQRKGLGSVDAGAWDLSMQVLGISSSKCCVSPHSTVLV